MLPDWKDEIARWARRNETIEELWLFGQDPAAAETISIGLVLASAGNDPTRMLGDFSLLDARWRAELKAITQRQVRLEPMVPGYPGDRIIRSIGICIWNRPAA